MSNRFHNKFHRANHHSQKTPKNSLIIDAALDPVASYLQPFQGEFYTDGEIVTNSFLTVSGDIFGNSNLSLMGDFSATNALLSGDLYVTGNLHVEGSSTQINTEVYTTSAVEITNIGTGPALTVVQSGNNVIAEFYDDTDIALFIDGRGAYPGHVGIGTDLPGERLTVVGSISSSWLVFDRDSNSSEWKSVYTSVCATSANWDSTFTSVCATSANWDSTFTSVCAMSANWDSTYTTVSALSTSWEESADIIPTVTTYLSTNNVLISSLTITDTLSVGSLLEVGTGPASIFVDTTKVGINTETPNVELTIQGDVSASGIIYGDAIGLNNVIDTEVRSLTADWNSNYTTVGTNSADWDSAYTYFSSTSANVVVTDTSNSVPGVSAISTILAVSALPASPDPLTLYVII